MTLDLTLKAAQQEDFAFLLELRNSSMNAHIRKAGLTPTLEFHKERINYCYDSAHIILLNNFPIGLLKLVKEAQSWTLVQIQLMPQYQSKGIGTYLIKTIMSDASAHGVSLVLSVYRENPARQLYQRLGFVACEETEIAVEMKWPG